LARIASVPSAGLTENRLKATPGSFEVNSMVTCGLPPGRSATPITCHGVKMLVPSQKLYAAKYRLRESGDQSTMRLSYPEPGRPSTPPPSTFATARPAAAMRVASGENFSPAELPRSRK
jgi:hypothetical protein